MRNFLPETFHALREKVQHSRIIHTHREFHVCRDVDDDMYLDCAVEGSAAYIVSGDKDLLILRDFMGVKIVSPHDFAKNFKTEK